MTPAAGKVIPMPPGETELTAVLKGRTTWVRYSEADLAKSFAQPLLRRSIVPGRELAG